MSDKPVLGFIGIGLMGRPMSLHLCEAGYEVHVFNRTSAKLAPLLEAGATAAESPAALTRAADIVFTCLSDTASMEHVVFGSGGIAEGAKENGAGKVLVDHSSIRADATRDMAARLRGEKGMGWSLQTHRLKSGASKRILCVPSSITHKTTRDYALVDFKVFGGDHLTVVQLTYFIE